MRDALAAAGVAGVEDLGRFVNNTQYFAPSKLDEQAAAPVLMKLLPELEDTRVVRTVARHLIGPWLKRHPGAYDHLRAAYLRWAPEKDETGWVLGDALSRAADRSRADDLVALAMIGDHGMARAFIVDALWRFRGSCDVEAPLRQLIGDPSVVRMALSSLQRTVGAEAMVPVVERVHAESADPDVRAAAGEQLRRLRRKLSRGT